MDNFRDIFSLDNLKSKIGPLPVWAWGLILGLAVVFVYYVFLKKRGADSGTTATTVSSTAPTDPNSTAAADQQAGYFDNLYNQLAKVPDATSSTPASSGSASGGYGGGYSYAYESPGQPVPPASITGVALPQTVGTIGGKTPAKTYPIPGGGSDSKPFNWFGSNNILGSLGWVVDQNAKSQQALNQQLGNVIGGAGAGIGWVVQQNQKSADSFYQGIGGMVNDFGNAVFGASAKTAADIVSLTKQPPPVTTPGNPFEQTHVPVSPGQKIADTTYSSGTPSKSAGTVATPARKSAPAPTPVSAPAQKKIAVSPGQKVAF